MPVVSPAQLEVVRTQYRRLIHNHKTSVKKIAATVSVQPDPRILARNSKVLVQWDDFYCSMFHFLSGKTDRLLSERGEVDLISQLGITPDNTVVVQYVNGLMLTEPAVEGYTTTVNNLVIGEEILWSGEWWIVKAVIPDSEGIQHTVFACK